MLVKELIEELKNYPQDALVVLSRDIEGNGYLPLYEIRLGSFYESEFGLLPEQLGTKGYEDYTEEDTFPKGVKSVCFWPAG